MAWAKDGSWEKEVSLSNTTEWDVPKTPPVPPSGFSQILLLNAFIEKLSQNRSRDVSCLQELRSSRRGFYLWRFSGDSKATEELRYSLAVIPEHWCGAEYLADYLQIVYMICFSFIISQSLKIDISHHLCEKRPASLIPEEGHMKQIRAGSGSGPTKRSRSQMTSR